MSKNIIVCGVGGQGTILASKLIAQAAMNRGIPVKTAETIGMAQRGGSVFSHLKLGNGAAGSLIGKGEADVLIGFEPGETVRHLPFLKKDGVVISTSRPIQPVSAMIGSSEYRVNDILSYLRKNAPNLTLIDSEKALQEIGNTKVLNVLLLGAAARSGHLGVSAEDIRNALRERMPEKLWEVNDRALEYPLG